MNYGGSQVQPYKSTSYILAVKDLHCEKKFGGPYFYPMLPIFDLRDFNRKPLITKLQLSS